MTRTNASPTRTESAARDESERQRLLKALEAAESRASAAEAERDRLAAEVARQDANIEDWEKRTIYFRERAEAAESRSARDREALREALELIDDLMPYALQHWDWKYGDDWKAERAALASTEDRHDD